jgi:hypothetical protein
MSNTNPWFLITCEEIRTIRENLEQMVREKPNFSQDPGRTITNVLDTVECRVQ